MEATHTAETEEPMDHETMTQNWMGEIERIQDAVVQCAHVTMAWRVEGTGGNCTALVGRYGDIEILVTADTDAYIPDTPDPEVTYAVGDGTDVLDGQALDEVPGAVGNIVAMLV